MYKLCLLFLSILLISFVFMQKTEPLEYVQEPVLKKENAPWWENDTLTAAGYGIFPENASDYGSARSFAKRAAVMDAYRNLAVQAGSIQITKDENVLQSKVAALLKDAEIVSEDYDEHGNCTVIMKIPIYGVTNSVAKIAFEPVAKEDFLPPSEEVATEGNYTGLIIDCGDAELNPVLAPTIHNEKNQSVYSYKNLDYDKVIANGMIGYKIKSAESERSVLLLRADGTKNKFMQFGSKMLIAEENYYGARAGNNPLIIRAVGMGEDNTCPIISEEDSDKILAENGVSNFLDNGKVVFVSNRVRGIRL